MFNQQGNSNQDKNEHLISMSSSKQNSQQNLNNESYGNENFFVHSHHHQQHQQHNFYPTPTSLSSSLGHKRHLTEEHLNQEEKENCGIPSNKRPYLNTQKNLFENIQSSGSAEEDAEDEEDEVEDESESSGGLRSAKTSSSSPECPPPIKQEQHQNTSALLQSLNSSGRGSNYNQLQQFNYSTPQQQYGYNNLISSTASTFPNFGNMHYAPLAHSTPYNFEQATLRNLQHAAIWGAAAAAGNSVFPSIRPPNRHQYNLSGAQSSSTGGVGSSENIQMTPYGVYGYPSIYPQQMLQNGLFASGGQQQIISSQLSNSSTFSNARDSGVGGIERIIKDIQKNESSSGGSSEESALSGKTGQSLDLALNEPKFPPYMRCITYNGERQLLDLEMIFYEKSVPARLSLLNNNKKYPISLAELCRRLHVPECLNTSYLSGILRRAKNKNGGKSLREDLGKYDCGLNLQPGKRKSSLVTAFSTLCEREAIQLAEDFDKLVKDPSNGFPHHHIAMEMHRRGNQSLDDIKSSMGILREAISIVQTATEQETLELTMPGELIDPQQLQMQQLMPDTLNQFKRFARISHCFGNRGIIACWQSLLAVFTQYASFHEGDNNNQQSSSSSLNI
uniref:Transcription factor AP-2 C-terminal domain-containing protein n=1 Tax=Meloidogyne enterolobii TaxID=390850 RepID=A0A6V7VM77_MELEN|nr:unnamed protein product [Meloidogyne enterolobii]